MPDFILKNRRWKKIAISRRLAISRAIFVTLVLPSLGRIEVVIPTILWFANVGFIVHCLHPSISFQFCFNPTYYLTCGMEGLSPLEPLLDKPPYLYCVSALSW